jgi:hypothetical protein
MPRGNFEEEAFLEKFSPRVIFRPLGEKLEKTTFFLLTATLKNPSVSLVGAEGFEPSTR